MKVYLDHAATTPVDKKVVAEMLPFFTEKFGNASSLHQFGRDAKDALEESRTVVAEKLNAKPKEIVFTSCGSESDNLALRGAAYFQRKLNKEKNHIITTKVEHPAVLGTCAALSRDGFRITYLDVDEEGFVDLEQLKNAITDNTVLVSIIHGNNEIGTIQDLEEIGKIIKEKNKETLFHSDAVQSFTKVLIDVNVMNLDLLSMSSHKIHGPKGVGALYVREGIKLEQQISGGHHEFDKRAGTENVSGIVGFAKAVSLMTDDDIKKMAELRDYIINEIQNKITDAKLNGAKGDKRLCNNVNISFKYIEGESILMHLDDKGIAVSTGSACSSQSLQPSHVLLAIGMKHEDAHGSVRISLGKENTKQEIDYAINSLKEVVESLRKLSPLTK